MRGAQRRDRRYRHRILPDRGSRARQSEQLQNPQQRPSRCLESLDVFTILPAGQKLLALKLHQIIVSAL